MQHNRYWWYRRKETDYLPAVYAALSDDEWAIMKAWFADTEKRFENPGEISIPGITMLSAMIDGNGLRAVVQCGHYVGYSTMLLGFLMRRMGKTQALFSIDIDEAVTAYAQSWIERAGLSEVVRLYVGNSSDPACAATAREWLGRRPQLVFIDSSHQYGHTVQELKLWNAELTPGGFLCLHDTSEYAQQFDSSGEGGVLRAASEWGQNGSMILMNRAVGKPSLPHLEGDPEQLTYADGCGFGIIQKPSE
jgi:predicted O-methyltransferase YrrM